MVNLIVQGAPGRVIEYVDHIMTKDTLDSLG